VIEQFLGIQGSNETILRELDQLVGHTETGQKGLQDLRALLSHLNLSLNLNLNLLIDPTLARGLNYYTGIIFEAKAPARVKMGSIGGGGRYDDLTGLLGVPGIPGVGISFGVDRIYDVLEELQLFPAGVHTGTQVLFFNLGEAESRQAFGLLQALRAKGVCGELYHESVKLDKQFRYAEKKQIPYVVIIGSDELAKGQCRIKTLATGNQETIPADQLTSYPFVKA
jgi:histidyl-tRNA synthetase